MTLAEQIEIAHQHNERKVTARIAAPRFELTQGEKNALGLFQRWARDRGVKAMPPAPAVVAAWVQSESESEIDTQQIVLCLEAIQKITDAHLLPSPISTAVVRLATYHALKLDGHGRGRSRKGFS